MLSHRTIYRLARLRHIPNKYMVCMCLVLFFFLFTFMQNYTKDGNFQKTKATFSIQGRFSKLVKSGHWGADSTPWALFSVYCYGGKTKEGKAYYDNFMMLCSHENALLVQNAQPKQLVTASGVLQMKRDKNDPLKSYIAMKADLLSLGDMEQHSSQAYYERSVDYNLAKAKANPNQEAEDLF